MKPKRKKRWRPKKDKKYFYINRFGDVDFEWWDYSNVDIPLKNFLGVYKTEAEAIEMRDAIKQFVTSKIGEP